MAAARSSNWEDRATAAAELVAAPTLAADKGFERLLNDSDTAVVDAGRGGSSAARGPGRDRGPPQRLA